MSGQWRHLPAPARPIAAAACAAVTAARARDAAAFATAANTLGGLDTAQVGLLLGTVVRLALEDLYPDGLDGDDVRAVLKAVAEDAAAWQKDVDPHVFLVLLAGALGVHDPDEDAVPPKPDVSARHAALLLAHLIDTRPCEGYLDRAAREIERTQLND
jgi:hypothetical protein